MYRASSLHFVALQTENVLRHASFGKTCSVSKKNKSSKLIVSVVSVASGFYSITVSKLFASSAAKGNCSPHTATKNFTEVLIFEFFVVPTIKTSSKSEVFYLSIISDVVKTPGRPVPNEGLFSNFKDSISKREVQS